MTDVEVLAPWVEKVVKEVLGVDHLHRDDDGDIPIALDKAVMYVRLTDGPIDLPRVRLFGPILKQVTTSEALFTKLNEVNHDGVYLRFYLQEGVIWGAMDAVAESFRTTDLRVAVSAFDWYGDNLAGLLDLPDSKPWREGTSRDENVASGDSQSDSEVDRDLQESLGAAAHAAVPSKVLPDDASPADGAMNIRLGYL